MANYQDIDFVLDAAPRGAARDLMMMMVGDYQAAISDFNARAVAGEVPNAAAGIDPGAYLAITLQSMREHNREHNTFTVPLDVWAEVYYGARPIPGRTIQDYMREFEEYQVGVRAAADLTPQAKVLARLMLGSQRNRDGNNGNDIEGIIFGDAVGADAEATAALRNHPVPMTDALDMYLGAVESITYPGRFLVSERANPRELRALSTLAALNRLTPTQDDSAYLLGGVLVSPEADERMLPSPTQVFDMNNLPTLPDVIRVTNVDAVVSPAAFSLPATGAAGRGANLDTLL